MARINTNVASVIAQANVRKSTQELDLRLERLSTGVRINRGKDDPAGLIISERIGADIAGIEQAVRNGERASSVIATTEAALQEVNDLLNSIKALMVEAANTGANSLAERDANQLQIDSAIDSITRIANTATFGGLRLLDGSLDYITSGVVASAIAQARVLGASLADRANLQVEVDVVGSAQTAMLFINGNNPGTSVDGVFVSTTTLRLTGNRGTEQITFNSGTSFANVIKAINQLTNRTGVTAGLINSADANSGIVLRSEKYGSDSFISVERVGGPDKDQQHVEFYKFDDTTAYPDTSGGFPWTSPLLTVAKQDAGRNVAALINGTLATGAGLEASINNPTLSVQLTLDEDFALNPPAGTSSFYITGGGALFQLGPDITVAQQANVGIQSVAASQLGGVFINGSQQFLASLKKGEVNSIAENVRSQDFTAAQDILSAAIDEVAVLRGRLGAFERNVLETNSRSLQAAFENLTASRSRIRDADFAMETSQLTRAQILNSSSTQVLGLANAQAQNVLQLLG